MEENQSLETLEAWKFARDLRIEISHLVQSFPKYEFYRLTDQIIRSSRSVTANIAEGYGRYRFQDSSQFMRQARGSLLETLDHLICACDEKYITEEILISFKSKIVRNTKILNGYIGHLQKLKKNDNEYLK